MVLFLHQLHVFRIGLVEHVVLLLIQILRSFLDKVDGGAATWLVFDDATYSFEKHVWIIVVTTEGLSVDANRWMEDRSNLAFSFMITIQEAFYGRILLLELRIKQILLLLHTPKVSIHIHFDIDLLLVDEELANQSVETV